MAALLHGLSVVQRLCLCVKDCTMQRLLLLCCLMLFSAIPVSAWAPPIGIPYPPLGIDEVRPARPNPWTSATAGYYYINAGTGSDTSNPYGTPAAPRRTIPNPIPVGSYAEVHGTYNVGSGGITSINGQGTGGTWVAATSGPVWVVGENSSTKPVFTLKTVVYGAYVYLDLVDIATKGLQVGSGAAGFNADNIVIRNCDSAGDGVTKTSGMYIIGASGYEVTNVVLYNNTIHHHGDIAASTDQDAIGIGSDYYVSNLWILENTVHTTSGPGIRVGGAFPSPGSDFTHHLYVGNNTVFNVRQAGIGVKYAADIVFSENNVYDIIDTAWSPSKGLIGQYGPKRLWMLYNTIRGVSTGLRYGIQMVATDGGLTLEIYIIGNVIYNVHHITGSYAGGAFDEACIHLQGGTSRYVVNNTMYNCDAGINISASAGNFQLDNNIISTIVEANGRHINVPDAIGTTTLNNNVLFQSASDPRIKWGSTVYTTLGAFQAATGKCAGCVSTDPLFINAGSADFHLAAGSPARNAGLTHSAYATFTTLYGLSIEVDKDHVTRPQDGSWDIGAFEFQPTNGGGGGNPAYTYLFTETFEASQAGTALTTHAKQVPIVVPVACTITGYAISVSPADAVTFKLWKKATGTAIPTVADVINTNGVSISSGTHIRNTTVSDFTTTAVAANDMIIVQLSAVGGAATAASLAVECIP